MRATRRRQRTPDPLASTAAIRNILSELRARCPQLIPKSEQLLLKLLEAIRHIERRPASDTKRGRPGQWRREDLLEVAHHLRAILQRETGGRISLSSFTGRYLRLLAFPADIASALEHGEINLQEAAQLSRLTPERLSCSSSEADNVRREVLRSHLALSGSQNVLRERVKEILGEINRVSTQEMMEAVRKTDELLEIDPSDKRHLFYEEMKRLFFAMRDVQPEDVDEVLLERFLVAADAMSNVLYTFELKRRQREAKSQRLTI